MAFWFSTFILQAAFAQVYGPSCYFNGNQLPSVLNAKGQLVCPTIPAQPSMDSGMMSQQMMPLLMQSFMASQKPSRGSKESAPALAPSMERIAPTPPRANVSVPQQSRVAGETSPASNVPIEALAMPENCKNESDPVTGHQYVVPQFSFAESRRCLFFRNQAYVSRIANNCKDKTNDPEDRLFSTTFQSTDGHLILGQSQTFDAIIEDMTILEQSKENTIYRLQMLKPNTNTEPVVVERIFVNVRKTGEKAYLLDRENKVVSEIKMQNSVRRNIMLVDSEKDKNGVSEKKPLALRMNAKLFLASNCRLAEEIQRQNLYRSSTKTTSPAVRAAGTK